MPWQVYIIRCKDGLFYTGITNDLVRRIKAHKSGNGCKFTRSRTPIKLLYSETAFNRSSALKREARIKKLSKKEKRKLINLRRLLWVKQSKVQKQKKTY
ncbi:MAG: GIY-YIG nuclease family protein [Candidatus Omnitrophica bacterium]|nr:GIY-YIG nuclease family protein [Candidatus Omnitrophota bacterium]